MKGLQCVDSTVASVNSNHCPAAILDTTRSTIKYNLTVKIDELTNRYKAHREAWHMGNKENREGTVERWPMDETGSGVPSTIQTRVICGGE